jgi:hypothetical protein
MAPHRLCLGALRFNRPSAGPLRRISRSRRATNAAEEDEDADDRQVGFISAVSAAWDMPASRAY